MKIRNLQKNQSAINKKQNKEIVRQAKKEQQVGYGWVYFLEDSEREIVRYVGSTISPQDRLQQHLSNQGSLSTREWVGKLKKSGEMFRIRLICFCPINKAKRLEQKLIRKLSRNACLLNITYNDLHFTHIQNESPKLWVTDKKARGRSL